jgi:glycosyltransferase involved in cell wall biosynthesis
MPYFSIIIPTYNRSHFLPKAIESVLSQSFADWELMVVDDGSTDNTKDVVFSYQDKRIRYMYQQNAERSAARNNGVKNSKGEFILFLDSDDFLVKDFLKNIFLVAKNETDKSLIFFNVLSKTNDKPEILFKPLPIVQNVVEHILTNYLVIQTSQAIVAKKILLYHMFDERFSLWEDTHLYLRLLAEYNYKSCNIDGVIMHAHENSTVATGMSIVKLKDVRRYLTAIEDLQVNHFHLFKKFVNIIHLKKYKDAKINMYLYQARQNKQFGTAYKIAFIMITNQFNFVNIKTFFKLPVHHFLSYFK